eukprot:gb/GECH01006260.1/.p1 GENE.gb/GECH01006260.1/~~gb/GECH01006260.1/.p1  ORF type:complete len:299 (+),score=65.82 gb/GECH01006260.1/:1-897(+)
MSKSKPPSRKGKTNKSKQEEEKSLDDENQVEKEEEEPFKQSLYGSRRLLVEQDPLIDFFEAQTLRQKKLKKEWQAATKIQSLWREYVVRKDILIQKKQATAIQTVWRAILAKRIFRKKQIEHRRQLRVKMWNYYATLIQCSWRGFKSRKYVHSYYRRKQYLNYIKKMSQETRNYVDGQSQRMNQESAQFSQARAISRRERRIKNTIPILRKKYKHEEDIIESRRKSPNTFVSTKVESSSPELSVQASAPYHVKVEFRAEDKTQRLSNKNFVSTTKSLQPFDNKTTTSTTTSLPKVYQA